MSFSGQGLPTDPELDRALAEIFQRLKLERYDEAAARLDAAKAQFPVHPALLEMEGDLAFARRRYKAAQDLYLEAHQLDPRNAKIEEKYGIAVLKVHEPQMLLHDMPDDDGLDFLWGQRRARPPVASAVLSLIFPGAGQVFNGDTVKGWLLVAAGAGLWTTLFYAWSYLIVKKMPVSPEAILSYMFRDWYGIFTIVFLLAWLYSIGDAFWVAHTLSEEQRQKAAAARMDEILAARAKRGEKR